MAVLGFTEAALATGVTRQTIYRYAKSGALSTVQRNDGSKGVDTSELMRVFGKLRDPETVRQRKDVTAGDEDRNEDRNRVLLVELEAARQALRMAENALMQANERERRLFDLLASQSRLLEYKPAAAPDMPANTSEVSQPVTEQPPATEPDVTSDLPPSPTLASKEIVQPGSFWKALRRHSLKLEGKKAPNKRR